MPKGVKFVASSSVNNNNNNNPSSNKNSGKPPVEKHPASAMGRKTPPKKVLDNYNKFYSKFDEASPPVNQQQQQQQPARGIVSAAALNQGGNNNNNNNNNMPASLQLFAVAHEDNDSTDNDNYSSRGSNNNNNTNNDGEDFDTSQQRFAFSTLSADRDDVFGQSTAEDYHTTSTGTSDNDDDGQSFVSGSSSNSSRSAKALAAKSSLPCGMTMPVLMTIVVLIPIIILVTLTALPLDEAIRTNMFLDDHREAFTAIRQATLINFWENLNSSYYIFNVQQGNLPEAQTSVAPMKLARSLFDKEIDTIISVIRKSDVEGQEAILKTLEAGQKEIAVERERIDTASTIGPDYRKRQVTLMEDLTNVFLDLSQDPRCAAIRHYLLVYTTVRKNSLYLTSSYSSVTAIQAAGFIASYYWSNALNLQSRYDSMRSLLDYTIRGSDSRNKELLLSLKTSPAWEQWTTNTIEVMLISSNVTNWAHMTSDNISEWFNEVNALYDRVDDQVLNQFISGEDLQDAAVQEAIIMALSVFLCVLALIAVIYFNNKEQARLERALDATNVLASAVQRFVPRNQLKTMGVRSITQVQPGMSTEVAQTITFSDIRQFTRLSESMSRLELFEWLQNYVERMTKVVNEEKSYIFAFLGDGLGICSPQPTYAVNAAIKMHVAVEALNLDIVASGGTLPIKIGVGIHHGVVVAGVFGDDQRLSVSMVAPDVNFASRLEALTKSFGVKILASEDCIQHISPDLFSYRCVGQVQVKGSTKAVKVFDIYQADDLSVKRMKDATKNDFENAIALLDTDRPQADKIFERLVMMCRMEGIHDMSCELYYRRKDAPGASDQSSVLSFEKDGSLPAQNGIGGGLFANNSSFVNNGSFNSSPLVGAHHSFSNSNQEQQQQQQQQNHGDSTGGIFHQLSTSSQPGHPSEFEQTKNFQNSNSSTINYPNIIVSTQQSARSNATASAPQQPQQQQQQQQSQRTSYYHNTNTANSNTTGSAGQQQQQHGGIPMFTTGNNNNNNHNNVLLPNAIPDTSDGNLLTNSNPRRPSVFVIDSDSEQLKANQQIKGLFVGGNVNSSASASSGGGAPPPPGRLSSATVPQYPTQTSESNRSVVGGMLSQSSGAAQHNNANNNSNNNNNNNNIQRPPQVPPPPQQQQAATPGIVFTAPTATTTANGSDDSTTATTTPAANNSSRNETNPNSHIISSNNNNNNHTNHPTNDNGQQQRQQQETSLIATENTEEQNDKIRQWYENTQDSRFDGSTNV